MADFPRSLREFQHQFPDDAACAEYLASARWPDGFRCPACGRAKAWRLACRARFTFVCAACAKEISVTAGTIMHRSHLPLSVWFWAAYLMATHSNGMSALQLQSELGIGSYKHALEKSGDRMAAGHEAAPRHGRTGAVTARRPGRGR